VLRDLDRAYLDSAVQRVESVGGIAVTSALLDAPVVEAINRHAAASGTDLLVMTTLGRGPLARFWLGSVADSLVRQASIPILLVRPKETAPDLAEEPVIRRVLIPVDGSELAEQILEPALALGDSRQTQYTLLRVVKQMTPPSHDPASGKVSGLRDSLLKRLQAMDHQQSKEAQDYLDGLAARLRAKSVTVQTRLAAHEQPAAAILDDVQKNAVDLIALATQGTGGIKRLFLGSVADKVVRGADTSVLVYRPVDKPVPAT
jgi:nucleotide-binding universal stress UspA family protein